MGALMSKFWFMLFPAMEYKIVVVGLDNAGKTTTLYKLHLGEVVTTHPASGSNIEEPIYKNIRFEARDETRHEDINQELQNETTRWRNQSHDEDEDRLDDFI